MASFKKTIKVETPFGTLVASATGDTDFPGIEVCLETQDMCGRYSEERLALVEATPTFISETCDFENPESYTLGLYAWTVAQDDYSDKIIFERVAKAKSARATNWEEYLAYLTDWTKSHSDEVQHYGSVPMCFEEWLEHECKMKEWEE